MNLRSITSGNLIPCQQLASSHLRWLFFLPSIKVMYFYNGLDGIPSPKFKWVYPGEIEL